MDISQDASTDDVCILGHFSTVTDVSVSLTHIATCDRDFRIRISQWPNCFVIRSFCLGHSDVVTALRVMGDALLSGSADGSLRLWSLDGSCLSCINCSDTCVMSIMGNGNRDGLSGNVVITAIEIHPHDPDVALFTIHGVSAVFRASGLSTCCIESVSPEVLCDGIVNGMATDGSSVLWVSLENSSSLHWWDLSTGDNDPQSARPSGSISPIGEESDELRKGEDIDAGRYDWLLRQRKKAMVEDWKGKKRRHIEI